MSNSAKADYRMATASKMPPKAVADASTGTIIAVVDLEASPERAFRALSTSDVERWWRHPEFYRQEGWASELRVCGPWSVKVVLADGSTNIASGEFAEIDPPTKLVMTRRFEKHPFQGTRETTITYRLEPSPSGTRLTVRDEGFIGRSQAAYGNAEHWERVLGWLDAYLSSHVVSAA